MAYVLPNTFHANINGLWAIVPQNWADFQKKMLLWHEEQHFPFPLIID